MNALDTSFVIDYWNGEDFIRKFFRGETDTMAIPTVACFELYLGAVLSDSPAEDIDTVARDLGWADTLPFSDAAAQRAAHIEADLTERGEKINLADVLIAATALEARAPLIATDSHFDRIDDLEVINPRTD